MRQTCKNCSLTFEVTDTDKEFFEKFDVPAPQLCVKCRHKRLLSFRNEKNLYKRKCDFSGKNIISIYSPDKPYKVYSQEVWWSDKWNALDYGQNYDFTRPFFEQFGDLLKKVPRLAIINRNSENSLYTNICEQNKNCYLLIESSNNEDSLYSYWIQKCTDCTDLCFCNECTECYECFSCDNCYGIMYSINCQNCADSWFLKNCIGCKNCFGCINLTQKQYYILNKPYSAEEYKVKIKKLLSDSLKNTEKILETFQRFCTKFPNKYAEITNSQNCTGNYIKDSRDCTNCYHANDAEHCKDSVHVWRNSKYVYCSDTVGMNSELAYECMNTAINSYNNRFCNRCWTVANSTYCNECDNSKNLFGCIGLNHKQYCILNKQYTREEYEELVPRIIKHMIQTGQWGEFFPSELSPFEYKETAAQDYF